MIITRPGYKQHTGTARDIQQNDYIDGRKVMSVCENAAGDIDVAFHDGGFRVFNVNTTITFERGILVAATIPETEQAANDPGVRVERESFEQLEVELPTPGGGVLRIKFSCSRGEGN